MTTEPRGWTRSAVAASLLLAAGVGLSAQAPFPATPTTAVMAMITIKPDADRAQLMKVLPDEVRATARLYLEGKILQWYSRDQNRGPVFILNCATTAEAEALLATLPLTKSGLATHDLTELKPLAPLGLLLAAPPAAPKP